MHAGEGRRDLFLPPCRWQPHLTLWIGAQPASVPYQPASPSWRSLEGLIKYQTKANAAAGHPWATWETE